MTSKTHAPSEALQSGLLTRLPSCRHGFLPLAASEPNCMARELDSRIERIVTMQQTHSCVVLAITSASELAAAQPALLCDAVVTSLQRVALGVYTADCMPILLFEPEARLCAAVHAGWRGVFGGIIEACLSRLESLGGKRAHVLAAIGPSIAQTSYPVGAEFRARFLEQDPANERFFQTFQTFQTGEEAGQPHFDLVGYGCAQLRAGGVACVEVVECDTAKTPKFASRRRSGSACGRNLSYIAII